MSSPCWTPMRAAAGDQGGAGLPERPGSHGRDLLPGLGHHGGWLEQHAQDAERGVDLGVVARLYPPALGHEPVDLLDAAFGVLPVAAHVPLADRAVGAGHRVRAPDDPDDQVAALQPAVRADVHHPTEGLVAQDQPVPAGGRPAVRPGGDLHVRAADAHRDRLHQDGPGALVRFGDVLVADGPRHPRRDADGLHRAPAAPVAAGVAIGAIMACESIPPDLTLAWKPCCSRIRVA